MKATILASAALAAALLAAAPSLAKEQASQDHDLNSTDRAFLKEAAMDNLAEVHLGILAVSHGSTPAVREFGRWMISTHSFANRELTSIAERLHDKTPPLQTDAKVQDTMGKLQNLKGVECDKAYLKASAADHEEAEKKLNGEAKNGEAPLVKGYAANFLPTVGEHLAQVKLLMADANGGDTKGAENDANMKAGAGGMGGTPQGNDQQAKKIQNQHSQ